MKFPSAGAAATGGAGVSAIGRGPDSAGAASTGTAAATAHAHVPAAVGLDLGQIELGGDARQLAHGFEVDAAGPLRDALPRGRGGTTLSEDLAF